MKAVLPALIPEMTYEGLDVANGQNAGLAWESLVRGGLDYDEQVSIRKGLLEYCRQDTLALVRIVAILQPISNDLCNAINQNLSLSRN